MKSQYALTPEQEREIRFRQLKTWTIIYNNLEVYDFGGVYTGKIFKEMLEDRVFQLLGTLLQEIDREVEGVFL